MHKRLLLAFICLMSLSTSRAEKIKIKLSDLGLLPNTEENTAPRLNAILDSLKAKYGRGDELVLTFAPGRYCFDAEGSPERELYISNHDQTGRRRVGILLEGFERLTLSAEGTEFLFRDRMLPLAVVNSKRVVLQGFSIDFLEPQISQVEIVSNKGKEGIVFRPAPWVNWRINDEGYFEAYGSNWQNTPYSGIVFNQEDRHPSYRIADLNYSTEGVKVLAEGLLHAPKWVDERLKPSMIVAMRTYYRPNPGIFIDQSEDISLKDVRIYYADGMGLLAQNSHNISLDRLHVALRASTEGRDYRHGRYFTTQADATHFSGCSGHISVKRGIYEHMMDDAINVHGLYLKLTKRIDDHTVEAVYMHNQAWGFEWGRTGDPVQFVYSSTFDSVEGYNRIASIMPTDKPTTLGAKSFRIRFEAPIPRDITPETGIGLENMRKTASVDFRYNTVRNNRARGALFNTPKLVEVYRNKFHYVSGAAIVASTDCNQWFESGQTQLLRIRENEFYNLLTSLYQFTEAVITLHPVIPKLKEQKTPFYGDGKDGITIGRNHFYTFDTPLLFAKSVKGIKWRKNTVLDTERYPKYHPNQERYKLIGSTGVDIEEYTPQLSEVERKRHINRANQQ